MTITKEIILIVLGFSSGVVISGGIFAFISVIGIVPRLAQKSKTQKYIPVYEDAIALGGIWGASTIAFDYSIPIGGVLAVVGMFLNGVFVGSLAVSLAEILNVMPIFSRRINLTQGFSFILLSMALGKAVGSALYFIVPGFYSNF